jgi:hypothetical protein
MEDFEQEQAYFDGQTAKMDIFAVSETEAYAHYRAFVLKALALLPEAQESPFAQWLASARLAMRREATVGQLAAARKSVEEYRQQHLGLKSFTGPRVDGRDALSVLFMFALDDWPSNPATQTKTSIVQAIDEFSSLYIEFFAHGRELVQVLKQCFGVQ